MNARVLFFVAGLVLGAIAGWITRPESAELRIGALSVEVQGDRTASSRESGPLTTGQTQHIAVYTIVGGVLGLIAGLLAGRTRRL